jgi:predicted nucleic acid-binding protein
MSRLVLLDSGPLGLVTNPRESAEGRQCKAWLQAMLAGGARVMVPQICDYEVRRELLRADRIKGIARLDALAEQLGYLPVETAVWHRASELWAQARKQGFQTADDKALDADVILAAQAQLAGESGFDVVVSTTNVGHLARFVDAQLWSAIV